MDKDLLATLLSWAATLSGYPPPGDLPELSFQPHSFFVDEVCNGRECRAVGWYNDGKDDQTVIFTIGKSFDLQ